MGVRPNNYWTYERCKEEAQKYSTRTEFCKKAVGAYTSALNHGWLDNICTHMIVKWKKKWASKELCQAEALKYHTRSEFAKNCDGAYTYAMRHGFLDEICQHMDYLWQKKWDNKDTCAAEARKYTRRIDFQRGSNGAYTYAMRHGFLDEICSHMQQYVDVDTSEKDKRRIEYVKKHLLVSEEEWEEIYQSFLHNDGKVLSANRIQLKRCIYVAEFPDHHAYVGLANNLKNRIRQHLTSPKSQIFRYIEKTGLTPVFYIRREFANQNIAQTLEGEVLNEYKTKGWKVLNRAKTGALGGSYVFWTKERCIEVAKYCSSKSYYIQHFSGAYTSSVKRGWINEINAIIENNRLSALETISYKNRTIEQEESSKKHKEGRKEWTYETLLLEAKKYKTRKDFKEHSRTAYKVAGQLGIRDEVCEHMIPIHSEHKWTRDSVIEEAKKYYCRKEFRDKAPGAYKAAGKFDIREAVCAHMDSYQPQRKWTLETLTVEAKKYKSKKEFRQNASGAYTTAERAGYLDDICSHMQPLMIKVKGGVFWTKERCAERARLYQTRMDFKHNDGSAYSTAVREGWLDDICTHMHPQEHLLVKWTKEACYELALQYETKRDFKKANPSAYTTAAARKWIDDICGHMIPLRKRSQQK